MLLELLPENDPRLKETSELWDFDKDGDPSELVNSLFKTMIINNAIGLAAPQCGIHKRIFVMGNESKLVACINPEFTPISENDIDNDYEGCLSFPGLFMRVKRPKTINASYQTISGELVTRTMTGLEARIFQHETNHLDGITFDKLVSKLVLNMAMKKRNKLR
jgi:peptide deformylase